MSPFIESSSIGTIMIDTITRVTQIKVEKKPCSEKPWIKETGYFYFAIKFAGDNGITFRDTDATALVNKRDEILDQIKEWKTTIFSLLKIELEDR